MDRVHKTVRIFGDSIMKGVIYNPITHTYNTLPIPPTTRFSNEFGWNVHNSAIFGCTVTKGLSLLQKSFLRNALCDIALLEFGGNDCDFLWEEISQNPLASHQCKTPLHQFDTTMREIISLLKERHIRPILMTLPPIDSERYLSHICQRGLNRSAILTFLHYDIQNIARHQELYSLTISHIAKDTQSGLIDVRSLFLARRDVKDLLCIDGIHPNEEGHTLIGDACIAYTQTMMKSVS